MSDLNEHFEAAKKMTSEPVSGGAAEKAMLQKETARLIKESAAFEMSKSKWRHGLMKSALVVAGISVVLNLVLGGAIIALTPLKTVEPYLLYVDKSTGFSEVRQPLDKSLPTYGEEADKYFIAQYIMAREGYDWGLAQSNYDTVKAYSEKNSVFNEYDLFIKSDKSPLAILADKARVVVDVNSITLDQDASTATVRFTKTVIAQDGKPSLTIPKTFWVATLRYEYPNPKISDKERLKNPFGMKIPSYQLVQEQFRG